MDLSEKANYPLGKAKGYILLSQQALKIAKEMHDEWDEAFVYNDLGATYLQSNYDLTKALDYLQKSIAIRERLNEKSEISYTYNYLGQAYRKFGDRQAPTFTDNALKAKEKGLLVVEEPTAS